MNVEMKDEANRGGVHLACLFFVAVADSGQGIFILLASISDS